MSKFKHIAKVGVELEGGWPEPFRLAAINYGPNVSANRPWQVNWHGDGSVHVRSVWEQEYYAAGASGVSNLWEGEGVCDPPQSPETIMKWVKHNHPRWVNATCGMHCHISFKDIADYEKLLEMDFVKYFEKAMAKWGKENEIPQNHTFWGRLHGTNQYCQRNKEGGMGQVNPQLTKAKKIIVPTKYFHLNFGAWRKYQTVECRVLPMFDKPEFSAKAIYDLLKLFEKYVSETKLTALPKRVMRIHESVAKDIEREKERIIHFESGGEKESNFSIEESESLVDDVVVRNTRDPNLPQEQLPDTRVGGRSRQYTLQYDGIRLYRPLSGTLTLSPDPPTVVARPVTEEETVDMAVTVEDD